MGHHKLPDPAWLKTNHISTCACVTRVYILFTIQVNINNFKNNKNT